MNYLNNIQAWAIDQLTKSEFFHQKLHEWNLLVITERIDEIEGEMLNWELNVLNISPFAWNKVIHRGIKPVTVFAHPDVLRDVPGSVGYYRMLSMVSQKSMVRIGLPIVRYESGRNVPDQKTALSICRHLNRIISHLIESDEQVNVREFDLWRGMAAGSQAQGSWQNIKGSRVEILVKGLIQKRLREKELVLEELEGGAQIHLIDGRYVIFGDEPDVAIYKSNRIRAAIEIKGGIDTAGILERIGAAIKSLRRAREENPSSITILVVQGVSLTLTARNDLEINRQIVTNWFTVESILSDETMCEQLFELIDI